MKTYEKGIFVTKGTMIILYGPEDPEAAYVSIFAAHMILCDDDLKNICIHRGTRKNTKINLRERSWYVETE